MSAASLRLRNSSSVTETGVIESISTWNTRKYKYKEKVLGILKNSRQVWIVLTPPRTARISGLKS